MSKPKISEDNVSAAKAYLMITRGQVPRLSIDDTYELRKYLRMGGYFYAPDHKHIIKPFRFYVDHSLNVPGETVLHLTLHSYYEGAYYPKVETYKLIAPE